MTKILSWNVNGIRAAQKKGFLEWLAKGTPHSPDILGVQEIKVMPEQLSHNMLEPAGYYTAWNPAERKGYSGTALFSKIKPISVWHGLGIERFDTEGRCLIAKYEKFTFMNIYFPNGQKDDIRLQYKLDYYDVFLDYANELVAKGEDLIICGDVNTAHKPIDLARPKANEKYSGFLPIERAWIDKFIDNGYVDTFRYFHPDEAEQYSWWSYRANARVNNVGWRLDYFFVNEGFLPRVKDAFILQNVVGSDHCPVGIEVDV